MRVRVTKRVWWTETLAPKKALHDSRETTYDSVAHFSALERGMGAVVDPFDLHGPLDPLDPPDLLARAKIPPEQKPEAWHSGAKRQRSGVADSGIAAKRRRRATAVFCDIAE